MAADGTGVVAIDKPVRTRNAGRAYWVGAGTVCVALGFHSAVGGEVAVGPCLHGGELVLVAAGQGEGAGEGDGVACGELEGEPVGGAAAGGVRGGGHGLAWRVATPSSASLMPA